MTKFYGLTGGIGSGKSTVASIATKMGIPTLDLDQLGKEIIQHDPHVLNKLVKTFGASILNQNKILDNKALANIAFATPENTQELNEIMHPYIQRAEMEWRRKQTAPLAIIEASVIIESGGSNRMEALIVVIADMAVREQRVLSRGNQNKQAFEQIIRRQCSDETRLSYADYMIENNSTMESLQTAVHTLLNKLPI